MNIKITKKEILLCIPLYFLFNTPYCFGYISSSRGVYIINLVVGILLTGYILIKAHGKINSLLFLGIKSFMIPYVFVTILSFFTGIFIYHLSLKPYISQSFILMVLQWTSFLVAYFVFRVAKEKSIKIITVTGVISYTTVIIRYISVAGLEGMFTPFNHRVNGIGLEVHGLTYCFMLIIIYYYITRGFKYILKDKLLWIVIIYIILGNKRAAYLGVLIAIVLYKMFQLFGDKKDRILIIATTIMMISLLGYVAVINTGMLQSLAFKWGIGDSFRFNFWNYFKSYYSMSPGYLGRTLFFTDYYMTLDEIHKMYSFSGQGQMHNDILRTYIGWGFIPFVYYYFRLLVINTKQLTQNKVLHAGWKFFPIICFFTVIEGFDNMLGSMHFNMLFYLLYFIMIRYNDTKFEIEHRRNKIKWKMAETFQTKV